MSVMRLGVTNAASQPAAAANLPHRLSSFVGREAERAEVAAKLEETRLLTLTGVGGCGKTSLALEVARDVGARFSDGVFWVALGARGDRPRVRRGSGAARRRRQREVRGIHDAALRREGSYFKLVDNPPANTTHNPETGDTILFRSKLVSGDRRIGTDRAAACSSTPRGRRAR